MAVQAFEGIVENGRIKLLGEATLPDQTTVYVIIPSEPPLQVLSPRLVHRKQAADFVKEVFPESSDASL